MRWIDWQCRLSDFLTPHSSEDTRILRCFHPLTNSKLKSEYVETYLLMIRWKVSGTPFKLTSTLINFYDYSTVKVISYHNFLQSVNTATVAMLCNKIITIF